MKSVPARPTSSFELTFGAQTLRGTILRLGERARLLTCASAPVCNVLSRLKPNTERLFDLVNVLLDGAVFARAAAPDREAALKNVSAWLTTLFGEADPGDPERWIEANNWLITSGGAISRPEARRMLSTWKEDTPVLTSRTLLARLATLRPHFRPKLLHFIAKKDAQVDRLVVATLHDLCPCDATWLAPVRPALDLGAGVDAPAFGDLLWAVVRTVTEVPAASSTTTAASSSVNRDNLNEKAFRIFRFVRQMKDGATVPLTAPQCCQLLALIPMTVCGGRGTQTVAVDERISRLFLFIKAGGDARVEWGSVLAALANFIRANRIDYRLTSDKNPPIEGLAEHEVTFDAGDERIQLIATRNRVTFFAEAHTYACADLRDGVVDRATDITFWPVEFTRVEVAAAARQLLQDARVHQLASATVSGPARYVTAVIDGFEVGVERRASVTAPGEPRLWRVYLTHLCPSPGTKIPARELQVVRLLLLRSPDE